MVTFEYEIAPEQGKWTRGMRLAYAAQGKIRILYDSEQFNVGASVLNFVVEMFRKATAPLSIQWERLFYTPRIPFPGSDEYVAERQAQLFEAVDKLLRIFGDTSMVKWSNFEWCHSKSGSRLFRDRACGPYDVSIREQLEGEWPPFDSWSLPLGPCWRSVELDCSFQQTREREARQAILEQHLLPDLATIVSTYT